MRASLGITKLMSGVNIRLSGMGGLGAVLLGLALASKHFGDNLLYWICLMAGVIAIGISVVTAIDAYYLNTKNARN